MWAMRRMSVVGALLTSFVAVSSDASATIRSEPHTLRIVASIAVRTVRLDGSGANLRLNSVRVNGHELTIGNGSGSRTATMYGEGVIVRFVEQSNTYSASVVAISGHPVVRISYTVTR